MNKERFFILTVDTEPDNEWGRPALNEMTTRNAGEIRRFQELCMDFGIRPVYLIDYKMSKSDILKSALKDALRQDACEIGAHLHPWSTPPLDFNVTDDDCLNHPFCTQYPPEAFTAKIETLVESIKSGFGVSPVSFRAGRYVISKEYLLLLKRYGFRVDCSVTPYRRWSRNNSIPGSDFRGFAPSPFFWDEDKTLLEVPISVLTLYKNNSIFNPYRFISNPRIKLVLDKLFGNFRFLLNGGNMFFHYKKYNAVEYFIIRFTKESDLNILEGMLHSSELVLGGCFSRRNRLDRYWKTLKKSFRMIRKFGYKPVTLSEYYKIYSSRLPSRISKLSV